MTDWLIGIIIYSTVIILTLWAIAAILDSVFESFILPFLRNFMKVFKAYFTIAILRGTIKTQEGTIRDQEAIIASLRKRLAMRQAVIDIQKGTIDRSLEILKDQIAKRT